MHLSLIDEVFLENDSHNEKSFYRMNNEKLKEVLNSLFFRDQFYNEKNRQMILSDIIEYIFLGRGYYSINNREQKELFIKLILYFVNILMIYDSITVLDDLRKEFLRKLEKELPFIKKEEMFSNLKNHEATVGLPNGNSTADRRLNKYFDSLLPKTAGGLWHELIVYAFLIRNDIGYVLPLLLTQRIFSQTGHLIPPDFLIIGYDKCLYGIEVGTFKELQSSSFVLQTAIPTLTLDTYHSRVSDRCPICNKWIPFCEYVIKKYSTFDSDISNLTRIKCLEECDIYTKEEIAAGECSYTKYSRKKCNTLDYTQHEFANGYHYHYNCVLDNVGMREKIISAKDNTALITHFPYYSGIDGLINRKDHK